MPTNKFTHISEPNRGDGLRVIAPIPDQLLARSHALQDSFTERFSRSSLHLPSRDDLDLTFARLIVPEGDESVADLNIRIEAIIPLATQALRTTLESGSQLFAAQSGFQRLKADDSGVSIVTLRVKRMNELRQAFAKNLDSTMDEAVPRTVSVTPIQLADELPMDEVTAHIKAQSKWLRPLEITFSSLKIIREFRSGRAAQVIEEFPVRNE